MPEFNIDKKIFNFDGTEETTDPEILIEPKIKPSSGRVIALHQREKRTLYRRAFSETQLMDVVGQNFEPGDVYHCITAGDVDGLSYLKLVIRQQPLNYVLISTWVMANDDILQIEEWLNTGKIKKCDIYLGEIFPNSYRIEYQELKRIITPKIGRVCVFKNHSKIFAGYGPKFYFGIQTSANINTNPRTENSCITISKDLYKFYKTYFDGIVSFDRKPKQKKLEL